MLFLKTVCLPGLILLSIATSGFAEQASEGEKLFALKVRPILREKCFGCHSDDADELKGGFNLQSRQQMLEGGDDYGDSAVVPGDADSSSMLAMVARTEVGYEMPPKDADKLSQEEVWAVRDWIKEGAPWPDDNRVAEIYDRYAEGVTVKTSGGLSDQWTKRKYKPEDLWAFQPIRRDFSEQLTGPNDNPIDVFIDRKLSDYGIDAAPPADRRTLIRRATFDLLGLPPSPDQVDQFLADQRSDEEAFAALVDRLLENSHYGEQWARHWLDVVRYADSSGFANDYERPNTWRYRDYVIRAFNDDKPFDEFARQQIAGDEMGRDHVENLIATGFLRMGPWEHTGMSVAKVTRQQWLDDITDSVGQVFLGQALQCCRCHDHKFDPIPTRDYYSMQAVFSATQFCEVDSEWLDSENVNGMDADRRYHNMRHKLNSRRLAELGKKKQQYEQEWLAENGHPYKTFAEAKKAGVPEQDLPRSGLLKTPAEYGTERIGRKWENRFSWEFDRYQPIAFTVYNGKTRKPRAQYGRINMPGNPMKEGELEKTAILTGGDPFSPATAVNPGPISAVLGAAEFKFSSDVDGRRTALAKWITDPDNSLTSRVIVNRVWSYHFGRGIAGNPNNFGATGKKPTHPLLLDWLATDFSKHGWSIKRLHRTIMNSRAYRRASHHPASEKMATADPSGDSYAVFRPRRLEAEEIRDAMLFVSAELNPEMGGIPVRPDMNLEAALQPRMIMGTFAPSYVPNPKPADRNRRSVYIHKIRGHRLPFMETFNQPGSETSCELRDQSNVTPQVFTLMNSEESNDRALALAARVLKQAGNDSDAIQLLVKLVYGRQPRQAEIEAIKQHWQQMTSIQQKIEPTPRQWPTEVVREAVDENTGKPFTFTEKLFVYEDYVPDLQPHEVDAKTRALGDVCLALLNSNEFVYVY